LPSITVVVRSLPQGSGWRPGRHSQTVRLSAATDVDGVADGGSDALVDGEDDGEDDGGPAVFVD
jgi:hypothetical protein